MNIARPFQRSIIMIEFVCVVIWTKLDSVSIRGKFLRKKLTRNANGTISIKYYT